MNLEIFYIFIPEFCPANGGVQVKGGENLSLENFLKFFLKTATCSLH